MHHSVADLELGELLILSIFLPQQVQPIEAEGIVVWKREVCYDGLNDLERRCFDSGVKFTTIDERDLTRIFQYIYEIGLHGIAHRYQSL